ncbi:MAG TPA: hypothetical protein VLS93_07535 [Anaeromyxobacteraceae bacterium]|nr:hypothetical protein [Anaeromyxobacteraceae bacterium]
MTAEAQGSEARPHAMNLVPLGLLALATGFAMHHEGYLPIVTPLLGLAMVAGLAVTASLTVTVRTCRVVSLLFSIFVLEYVKESIGIRCGLWAYHGNPGHYLFGVWLWVIAGSAAWALARKVTVPLLVRARVRAPRWVSVAVIVAVAAVIPVGLGGYRRGTDITFAAFYAALAVAGVVVSLRTSFASSMGLVATAWVAANVSEYVGSMGSGIWTFPLDPGYPPLFLLLGCWPLEIVAQASLSALLASESLDLSPVGTEVPP